MPIGNDYDERGRCILKKLPGAKACRYKYDPADRLVAEHTHNHENGKWRLYAYDGCGRRVLVIDASLSDTEAAAYASVCRTATLTSSGNIKGYSVSPAPAEKILSATVETASYYDTYDFIDNLSLSERFGYKNPLLDLGISSRVNADGTYVFIPQTVTPTGKLTGLWTGKGWESYHYNSDGLEIQRYSTGFNQGRRSTFYNHIGNVTSVHFCYDEGNTLQKSPRSLRDRDVYYKYDNAGRTVGCKIVERFIPKGSSVEKTDSALQSTTYDRLGRVSGRKAGTMTSTFVYDVHGWLRQRRTSTSKWTQTEDLSYEDGTKPRYNGFLSERTWNGGTTVYEYDKNGFLSHYVYENDKGEVYDEYMVYDERGNVMTMDRSGVLDILPSGQTVFGATECVYGSFTGNLLSSVMVEDFTEIYDRETGMVGDPGTMTYSLGYDDAGRLVSDGTRGIVSIGYDNNGFTTSVLADHGDKKTQMIMVRDYSGNILARHIHEIKNGVKPLESTNYNGDGQVIRNDTLVMSRFEGGYFDRDGKPHYYLTDWQGNNIRVVNVEGWSRQSADYYPYGEPWVETDYSPKKSENRYLFGGKERIVAGRLNEYDFLARTYVASQCRFTSIDPLAEETPWLSPYTYCAGNPINFIDPDGRHTRVADIGNGRYRIVGGNLEDDDLNIYEYFKDENGDYTIRGKSIGMTTSLTSFYNSDSKKWAIDNIIDPHDLSGIDFLTKIFDNPPNLATYAFYARNGQTYDFKVTNGTGEEYESNMFYRGMPTGINIDGKLVYTSARDIGNIVAGYVAGKSGLSWEMLRFPFDAYQSLTDFRIKTEGISSQNAQYLGWQKGYYNTSLESIIRTNMFLMNISKQSDPVRKYRFKK